MAMSEMESLVDELQRIHDGDAWHGPALREVLTGVSAEQAAARPFDQAHNIWELVRHVTAWENVFRRRLEGEPVEEPEEGDFPPADDTGEAAWAQAVARLDQEHARLIQVASGLPDSALQEKVAGRDYTVRFQLASAVRHYVYHTGQIALLKKG
jgi:uncharacterized damage-inducible protein DinB